MDTGKSSAFFDISKAKATVEKGRRAKWWCRSGRSVRSFKYIKPDGSEVTDDESLERIRSLVVPPAWKFVRINPYPGGKIQAVGVDSTGRIQYLYHPVYASRQQRKKFAKIERFGQLLPELRRLTNEHIAMPGLPREKVLAVAMRLINSLYFRVGTDLSARVYKTYGITTLQKRHLTVGRKGKLLFEYVGKSHVRHRKVIVDDELAGIVKDLSSIGRGGKLFRYLDENGKPRAITPGQINAYLKSAVGPEFSAKDFRTWGGSVLAASEFALLGPGESEAETKKNVVRVVKRVAEELGNTPTVCRNSYIHPVVISSYISGTTIEEFRPKRARKITRLATELEPEEKALLHLFDSVGK